MFGRRTEFFQYKFLVDGLSDEILKKRVETSLRFYIKKANKYRKRDAFLGMLSIVLPALATFASAAAGSTILNIPRKASLFLYLLAFLI